MQVTNGPKLMNSLVMTMGYWSHKTSTQKTIAYSGIVVGILAVISAFGTSIHIAYHVFNSSGLTRLTFCIELLKNNFRVPNTNAITAIGVNR